MDLELTSRERRLLNALQSEFPLVSEPWKALARMIEAEQDWVLGRVRSWQETGLIRRLGAVFDSAKLGYVSTLLAARVPGHRFDQVAAIINEYPGVTHNYLRDVPEGDYNLWFTLTSPDKDELETTVSEITHRTGVEIMNLPKTRMFKIDVNFRLDEKNSGEKGGESRAEGKKSGPDARTSNRMEGPIDDSDKRLIMVLQDDLPLSNHPFADIGREAGLRENLVLNRILAMLESGIIRRFGATLKHMAVGYGSNVMAVWKVPDSDVERVGKIMAAFRGVSHCYARKTHPDWPYNLYTMIHARDRRESSAIVEGISAQTGVREYRLLHTLRELKKQRMRYERNDMDRET